MRVAQVNRIAFDITLAPHLDVLQAHVHAAVSRI